MQIGNGRHNRDVADHLCIGAFAMAAAITALGQSTVTSSRNK